MEGKCMDELIELKAGAPIAALADSGLLQFWREAQRKFLTRLQDAPIGSIIFDYDGTVYAGGQRNNAYPDAEMQTLLVGLLEKGVRLGFASGRGESLRDALRGTFPRSLWPKIYAAYQDGAEVGRLDDDAFPTPYTPDKEHIALAQARIKLGRLFQTWPEHIDMRPENGLLGVYGAPDAGRKIFAACSGVAVPLGLKVFHGGRMTDITLPVVSKRTLEEPLGGQGEVLAIGDSGAWPGNDCELLAMPLALSVGSVSPDPDSCWRLTRKTGIEATKHILRCLTRASDHASGTVRLTWQRED